ncbi:hypothetical protein KZ838_25765, partial [Pseudomonas aeruginosa]|uniref:hypothetical protein n=1 Tax=Pseudomonas aeruginosa TaxID=287 RepID=UPI001CA5DB05
MRRSLLFCGALLASLCAWAEPAQVRLLSSDFVLPGKHQRLAGWAREAGVELRGLRLGIGEAPPGVVPGPGAEAAVGRRVQYLHPGGYPAAGDPRSV